MKLAELKHRCAHSSELRKNFNKLIQTLSDQNKNTFVPADAVLNLLGGAKKSKKRKKSKTPKKKTIDIIELSDDEPELPTLSKRIEFVVYSTSVTPDEKTELSHKNANSTEYVGSPVTKGWKTASVSNNCAYSSIIEVFDRAGILNPDVLLPKSPLYEAAQRLTNPKKETDHSTLLRIDLYNMLRTKKLSYNEFSGPNFFQDYGNVDGIAEVLLNNSLKESITNKYFSTNAATILEMNKSTETKQFRETGVLPRSWRKTASNFFITNLLKSRIPLSIFNGTKFLFLAGIVINRGGHFVALVRDKIKGLFRLVDDLNDDIEVWNVHTTNGNLQYPFRYEVIDTIHTTEGAETQIGRLICDVTKHDGLCKVFFEFFNLFHKTVEEVMKQLKWTSSSEKFLDTVKRMNQTLDPEDVGDIIQNNPDPSDPKPVFDELYELLQQNASL